VVDDGRTALLPRLVRNDAVIAGSVAIAGLVALSVFGPMVAHHGPLQSDFAHGVAGDSLPVGPSPEFPLGADRLFRDVLARLAWGGRLSLLIALSATAIATVLGTALGVVAGWCADGRAAIVDDVVMRGVDVLLALPFLLLVMAIGAALDHTSAVTVLVTLGATGWLGMARIVRAKTLQVRVLDYVAAARALGQSAPFIIWRHVLPNIAGTVVVVATTLVAQMIVADSVLGYLGVGIAPPTPTWGTMMAEGQDYGPAAPWLVAAPGGAILFAVWGFNMLGEGLRDALDPHER
jgi:ABC-type dipeptide/oligopeptide/nickel transport system permease subunit